MENEKSADSYLFLKSAFYTGKLLHATDLIRERNYGNNKLEFMNRKFCGWGIIEGLEVRIGHGGKLFLSKGSAMDSQGRILIVPEDRMVKYDEIENFQPESGHELVLGIRYAEKVLETERDFLKNGECYQPSVIAETYALQAFGMPEYRKRKREAAGRENLLTEEKVLYENGEVELTVRIPKTVPVDSLFKMCIQVRTEKESNSRIGWRGILKLQGAVFAHSGESSYALEEEPAMRSGSFQRELEICTEENRAFPVTLEISHLKIITENMEAAEIPACQLQIETTASYDQTIKGYLRDHVEQSQSENWVPLACLRVEGTEGQGTEKGRYVLSVQKEAHLRIYASRPCEEELLKRIAEENGIFDIRWSKIFKHVWRFPMQPDPGSPGSRPPMPSGPRPPMPPGDRPPGPPPERPVLPPEGLLTEQRFRELMDSDRENRISRGVIVIPVPRRYRKGQVLLSGEISHGFPGEEVFLQCGRVWEEQSYIYWERDRKRYRIIHGEEGLFSDVCDGQDILKQAVLQNVESGTFQVALTLKKGRRRKRSKEVAISWIAVKSV